MNHASMPTVPSPIVELWNLFEIVENQNRYPWKPFREGVDIHRLYGDGVSGPTAALLRFRERTQIPPHVHEGYEHIFVLAGEQTDAHGRITAGMFRVHAPGTTHTGIAEAGCIVLAIYEKAVRFL